MKTIRENISFVRALLEDPSAQPQHAIAYPPKMIYYALMLTKENVIFSLKGTRKNTLSFTRYYIPCVIMDEVDKVECPCLAESGCTWMKSRYPLPKFKMTEKLTVIAPDSSGDGYGYVEWNQISNLKNSRRSSFLNEKYSIRNLMGQDYLYTHGPKYTGLSVEGPFNDVLEVMIYISKCDKKSLCNFLDTPMDLPLEYTDMILKQAKNVVKELEDKNIFPDSKTDDRDGSKYIRNPDKN